MPLMCGGIQHSNITQFAKDTVNLQFCHERWHYIRGEWYSKDCSFIDTPAGLKSAPRCTKCSSIHSNIRAKRFPTLFSERQTQANDRIFQRCRKRLILEINNIFACRKGHWGEQCQRRKQTLGRSNQSSSSRETIAWQMNLWEIEATR